VPDSSYIRDVVYLDPRSPVAVPYRHLSADVLVTCHLLVMTSALRRAKSVKNVAVRSHARSPIYIAHCAAYFIELSPLLFLSDNKQFLFSAFTSPIQFTFNRLRVF
jgi:hypothetical protein